MVDIIQAMAIALVASMAGQFLALRADVNLPGGIEFEIFDRERLQLFLLPLPAMNAVLEALLIGKALIPLAKLNVGDVSIDPFRLAERQAVEAMIVAVSR